VIVVEHLHRVHVRELRNLPGWSAVRAAGRGRLTVEVNGGAVAVEVALSFDRATFGRRTWIACGCGCGQRGRYGYLLDGVLRVRRCTRTKLGYLVWSWPDSAWRVKVGRPVMAARRRARAAGSRP
jgi:hypothetical protein